MSSDIRKVIEEVIGEIARAHKINLPPLKGSMAIVDELGFSSLAVASLIANLEEILEIDPFQDENVMITDIRTIDDLCNVYADCLASV